MQQIELGAKYRDIVSGFEGIAIGEHRYLSGCVQVSLKPPVTDKTAKNPPESWAFDVEQLKRVGDGVLRALGRKPAPKSRTGGPDGPAPTQHH